MEYPAGTCFLTDSGDNVGSGADGFNTYVLRQILALDDFNNKSYLVAGIVDKAAYKYLYNKQVNDEVEFDLGADLDEMCKKVHVKGKIIAKGLADKAYAKREDIGTAITVKLNDAPVYVVIEYDAIQYVDLDQFECSGLDVKDYDVIVVKEGYISDDYNKYGDYCVMSLTQGPTYQKSEGLIFRQIMRPCFPYDDLELDEIFPND